MFCFLLFFFRTHQIKCDGTGENRGDADEMIPVKRLAEKYGARQDAYDGSHIVEKPYVHRRKRLQRIGGEKRGDREESTPRKKIDSRKVESVKGRKNSVSVPAAACLPAATALKKRNPIMLMAQAIVNGV